MQKGVKLNQLMAGLPSRAVLSAAWLEAHGYGRALRQQYLRRGWLERVARGAYRRPGTPPGWESVLSSLQCLDGTAVVVGGRTALNLAGFAHYLPQGRETTLKLWSAEDMPGWFREALPGGVHVTVRNPSRLFSGDAVPRAVPATDRDTATVRPLHSVEAEGLVHMPRGPDGWPLAVSSPERAVLELLHEVPGEESFEQVDDMFDGFGTLSPSRLGRLLPLCHHVRTVRLFAWFARRHDHPWVKHVDFSSLAMGTGKRQVVSGGEMDVEFGITVPKGMGRQAVGD